MSSHLGAWAGGERLRSRLAWADTFRNLTLLETLIDLEPLVVLELGCGTDHPMGKLIAGAGLDTHYIGIDKNRDFANKLLLHKGKRAAVGVAHDLSHGIPMEDNSADVILCLEAMEHFCSSLSDVSRFFAECSRVLSRFGRMWLATPVPLDGPVQHPHCHEHEFHPSSIQIAAEMAGIRIDEFWNYRARPNVVDSLRGEPVETRLPRAVVDAYELPELTYGCLVPGNAVFSFSPIVSQG